MRFPGLFMKYVQVRLPDYTIISIAGNFTASEHEIYIEIVTAL